MRQGRRATGAIDVWAIVEVGLIAFCVTVILLLGF